MCNLLYVMNVKGNLHARQSQYLQFFNAQLTLQARPCVKRNTNPPSLRVTVRLTPRLWVSLLFLFLFSSSTAAAAAAAAAGGIFLFCAGGANCEVLRDLFYGAEERGDILHLRSQELGDGRTD